MKTIFISLPFTGKEDTLGERFEHAKKFVSEWFPKSTWVAQHNIDKLITDKKSSDDYAGDMGKDIASVLSCNAILMCDGWEDSKGCNLEYQAAKIFGKAIIFEQKD